MLQVMCVGAADTWRHTRWIERSRMGQLEEREEDRNQVIRRDDTHSFGGS